LRAVAEGWGPAHKEAAVQIIVEVGAGVYASEQYRSRIKCSERVSQHCLAQSLEAHGYYWRWLSEALLGKVLRMAVRRFFVGAAQ